ncbi:MAG: hypothetical protein JO210_16930 [Acidobacteriaceae bacterium]|nr:hypothetical protein [Acidobacteriaceae bacterium]
MYAISDPNIAFLLLVAGALGIYWELHAPGGFLPGILGVFLFATGLLGLWQDAPTWYGSILILMAILLLAAELKFGSHGVSGVAGAVLLSIGAIALFQGPRKISPALAIAVSVGLCIIAVFLGYLGLRVRRSASLTGIQRLVGEKGISRTAINSQGTVFIRGEYWQARSQQMIPAGAPVLVERVQDLILYVKEA